MKQELREDGWRRAALTERRMTLALWMTVVATGTLLGTTALGATPLGATPLGATALGATPLGATALGGSTSVSPCPAGCSCQADSGTVLCTHAALTALPQHLPSTTLKLDLSYNNITELEESTFWNFPLLEELFLGDNHLLKVHPQVFKNNVRLKRLSFQNCALLEVPWHIFHPLKQLTTLQLDQNEIRSLRENSLEGLWDLRNLRLDRNKLKRVPSEALSSLSSLQVLNLGNNLLTHVPVNAFSYFPRLIILLLKRNHITSIQDDAFTNLTSLKILELDDNFLTHIPLAITKLTALQELSLSGNKIKYIPNGILQKSAELSHLELKGNPLVGVDPHAFSFLPRLRKLILSDAKDLSEFPSLNGTESLELLRIDRAAIRDVPDTLCQTCPNIKSLDLKSNSLSEIPHLVGCKDLRVLNLARNMISSVEGRLFKEQALMHDLLLSHNRIISITKDAFYGLTKLQVLDLESNRINFIHPEAFLNIGQLEDLNLGNNLFPILPTDGLDRLLHLKTYNNAKLRVFPEPQTFPRIQSLVLSYAYHCCAFLPLLPAAAAAGLPSTSPGLPSTSLHESVFFPTDNEFDMSLWNSSMTDIWPQLQNLSNKFGTQIKQLWDTFGTDFTYPGNLPAYVEEYFEDQENTRNIGFPTGKIQCLPTPGPFLPCVDLFDWWTLRCGVWLVFLLAMLGNGTVVFVLIFSRSKMDVPRFLVCNLAAADFFMGLYLGMLAVVDASTLGEFQMFAIPWQMSSGCQLAGFLAVLSSELSVYTLAVITLERNYAITHAMHLNKRLSLKNAGYIMFFGWLFALLMAVLPLFGVSDYRKFATCLPFETNSTWSLTYVVFLMFINGIAFLILMGCYLKMYCAIRGSQAWNSNDSRIAKRMALLVFTDFLCWSPVAFFSLTAAFGLQLVSLEQAKVFTVFVLPLNSCCNPFLYAILTKQFKKDCILICKAIEESRVTRGIGRCRHSSNFSNRQTPANTNSLVDRSSREHHVHQPCLCNIKLLNDCQIKYHSSKWWMFSKLHWLTSCIQSDQGSRHRSRSDQYAYQIAEIQKKQHKRTSSVSSSENFSSSRSDSWRQTHHCGIPMRLLDPKKRASSWIVTRKTSQDSNLSSSRNDSSGSATTNSTTMSRISRSSNSSDIRPKPRLTRQSAVQEDSDPPSSPAKLTVRFLSAVTPETNVQQDDGLAILHASADPTPESSLYSSPSPCWRGDTSLPTRAQHHPS